MVRGGGVRQLVSLTIKNFHIDKDLHIGETKNDWVALDTLGGLGAHPYENKKIEGL